MKIINLVVFVINEVIFFCCRYMIVEIIIYVCKNDVRLNIFYISIEYLYLLKMLLFGWKKLMVRNEINVSIKWVGGIMVNVEIYYMFIVDFVNVIGCRRRRIRNMVD